MASSYDISTLGLVVACAGILALLVGHLLFTVGAFRSGVWVGVVSLVVPPVGWFIAFLEPALKASTTGPYWKRQRAWSWVAIGGLVLLVVGVIVRLSFMHWA
jgi:hypothetical protein